MLEDAIDFSTIRRVLVIKLRHIGDVLLTSPVFTVLKNHAPHLEIDALVYQDTADMLTLHPAIEQVHTIDRNWKKHGIIARARAEWRLASTLRARHYDLVVHLTEHPRGAWIKRLTGAHLGVARVLPDRGRLWRNTFSHLFHTPPPGVKRHTVEVHLDALRRLGVRPGVSERHLTLIPGDEAQRRVDQLLLAHGLEAKEFVHVHPTSRWFFKVWPMDKVADLIDQMVEKGHRIALTSAPDSEELALIDEMLGRLRAPVINLAGKLSLKELAALTHRAKLFIGVDSAPMHIAAAMGTPSVAIFGPSGDWEWGPWQVPHRLVMSGMICRPCGQDGCGGGKVSECLTTLPVGRVLEAADALLAQ